MAVQMLPSDPESLSDALVSSQFDPVQFLNDRLPTPNLSSQVSNAKQQRSTVLQTTSADVQTFLSKLSTYNVRSAAELTTLTDEILRSGNRLAYEVEVLRGDVNSLYELLTESLKDDIARFVLQEIVDEDRESKGPENTAEVVNDQRTEPMQLGNEPEFIHQLKAFGLVKARLESVIGSFDEALKWPVAPSEVSVASSLISVSAPELGVANSAEDDKAREHTKQLRSMINEALDSEGGGVAGLELATQKVDYLRALSQVWKGTAEEKARARVVDGLAKLVDDRRKITSARTNTRPSMESDIARSSSTPTRSGKFVEGSANTAAGLFRNLQKLRDEIYLD